MTRRSLRALALSLSLALTAVGCRGRRSGVPPSPAPPEPCDVVAEPGRRLGNATLTHGGILTTVVDEGRTVCVGDQRFTHETRRADVERALRDVRWEVTTDALGVNLRTHARGLGFVFNLTDGRLEYLSVFAPDPDPH